MRLMDNDDEFAEELRKAHECIVAALKTDGWSMLEPSGNKAIDSRFYRGAILLMRNASVFISSAVSSRYEPKTKSEVCQMGPFAGHRWDALAVAMAWHAYQAGKRERKKEKDEKRSSDVSCDSANNTNVMRTDATGDGSRGSE